MEFSEAWDHACSSVGLAARKGSLCILQKLVEKGKPVDVADNRGWRPLHEAVYRNHIACVHFLLTQENTNVNWRTFQDESALHLACERNFCDVVKLLLDHEANVDDRNNEWRTPLILAVMSSAKEIVTLLLEHSVDVNAIDMNEWTALHFAVSNKDTTLLKLLLRYNANFRLRDEHGRNAIFIACQMKSFECMKILFEFAAQKGERDIINVTTTDGANALMIAAEKGCFKILKFLLENGGNVNQITNDGCLALHLAALVAGDVRCVNLLLEKTDLEILKQNNVRDLIHLTVANQRHAILQILLNTNIQIDVECKLPRNPNLPIYDYSEARRANFQIANSTVTPLGRSVYAEDSKSVEMLLKAGANPNAVSSRCLAPLTLLFDRPTTNHDILITLLKAGAAVNYSKVDWCESEAAVLAIHFNKWDFLNTLILAGVDDINFTFKIVTSEEKSVIFAMVKPEELIRDFLTLAAQCLQWPRFQKILNYYSDKETLYVPTLKQNSEPFVVQPPSLKHFSRLKLRKLLMSSGVPSLYKIDLTNLNLPATLKKYILFEDCHGSVDWVETSKSVQYTSPPLHFGDLSVRHPSVGCITRCQTSHNRRYQVV